MAKRCMLCKREVKVLTLSAIHGSMSIKDWIIGVLGPLGNQDNCLNEERGTCVSCLYLLNNMLAMKRCLVNRVLMEDTEINFVNHYDNFINTYETFLHNLRTTKFVDTKNNKEEVDNDKTKAQEVEKKESNLNSVNRDSPHQNQVQEDELDLLTLLYSEPHKISGATSRVNRSDTPSADSEIANVFNTRRKKRRKKLSERWTRVKRSQKRSQSVVEELKSRSRSGSRPRTSQSMLTNHSRTRSTYSTSDSSFDDDDNITTEMDIERFSCIPGCNLKFYDQTALTQHKVLAHKLLAKFWCYECHMLRFTSDEDLKIHKLTTHKRVLSHCLLCSQEVDNIIELQYHMLQHKKRSVPCLYCEKSFLTTKLYRTHLQLKHKNAKYDEQINKFNKNQKLLMDDDIQITSKQFDNNDRNNQSLGHVIVKELHVRKTDFEAKTCGNSLERVPNNDLINSTNCENSGAETMLPIDDEQNYESSPSSSTTSTIISDIQI